MGNIKYRVGRVDNDKNLISGLLSIPKNPQRNCFEMISFLPITKF